MSAIIGRGDRQFLLDDDGTVWSIDHTIQYDKETFNPISNPTPTQVAEIELQEEVEVPFKCEICGFVAKNNVGLSAHKRFNHKGE